MTPPDASTPTAPVTRGTGLWLTALLMGLLALLFARSFETGEILFVNDTTLGQLKAASNHLPQAFTGTWHQGWVGIEAPAASPTISTLLRTVVSPELYLKIYAPFTLLFLGLSAWAFFCQLEFGPWVCALGGLAAALNMHFFSIACWGLGEWNIAAGLFFLALAALCARSLSIWAKGILAGLAVGLTVMEGFDVGLILSLYIAAFILWRALALAEARPAGSMVAAALGTEALVIFFALFIAAHSISTLVATQISGTVWATSNQNATSREERWALATQWSLPKVETLGVAIPGLFGYRMIDRINGPDKSSAYWGIIGRDPRVADLKSDDPPTRASALGQLIVSPDLRQRLDSSDGGTRDRAILDLTHGSPSALRFSGSGEYAGVLVSLLAIFALANSWRGAAGLYAPGERRAIWFWGATALVSLMAAWGRYGFLYRVLYQLPYAHSIRNPVKFMHPFHLAWLILAAYGLEALWRHSKVITFDRKWIAGGVAVAAALVGTVLFSSWKPHLVDYLAREGFAPDLAPRIVDFSISQARWFVGLLAASAAVVAILLRAGNGPGKWAGWIGLGLILIIDSARADRPWINYYNYQEKYAANSVLEFLQDRPYEYRVTGRLAPRGLGAGLGGPFGQLYFRWLENDFPSRNIETLDFAQWPRTPVMDLEYMNHFALQGHDALHCDLWPAVRLWQLTGTRYILTATIFRTLLNEAAGSEDAFHVQTFLAVAPKPEASEVNDAGDLTVVPADNHSDDALIEFTNVLPRAKLYSSWQTPASDEAALQTLLARDFDPWRTVLVSSNAPVAPKLGAAAPDPGEVNIIDYRPRDVRLRARALTQAILLLNDRMTPDWKAWVDEKPAPVLRCNYLMRGVYLPPGEHSVEFRYQPQTITLWVSVAAWGVGLLTVGYLSAKSAANSRRKPGHE